MEGKKSQRVTGASVQTPRERFSVHTHHDLLARCHELSAGQYLVEGLIRERSVGILVGDSGLGKSPFLYQAAVCIAAGIPFLGHSTSQGRVLYMDFENGLRQVEEMVSRISRFLGLGRPPKKLLLWNFNDCAPNWGNQQLKEIVQACEPKLVIIDSLSAYEPLAEEKNATASLKIRGLRGIVRDTQSAILLVHHLRKAFAGKDSKPIPLTEGNVSFWFHQARGASALINGTDIRLCVDRPYKTKGKTNDEIALVLGGFERVEGERPLTYLERVCDEDGNPVGYQRLKAIALLGNATQEATFEKLPDRFRFKEAKDLYGRGDQATTDFLNKCIGCGILRRTEKGYEKVLESTE